jgi:hypothetical protein
VKERTLQHDKFILVPQQGAVSRNNDSNHWTTLVIVPVLSIKPFEKEIDLRHLYFDKIWVLELDGVYSCCPFQSTTFP